MAEINGEEAKTACLGCSMSELSTPPHLNKRFKIKNSTQPTTKASTGQFSC
jgi:hypothetical protein